METLTVFKVKQVRNIFEHLGGNNMRKVLLATSALVAGSAMAASAVSAAEAPTLDISGKINIQYTGESYDKDRGAANTDAFAIAGASTELTFDANAEADNGLKYGGRIELRPTSGSTTSDEIWIDFAGDFGTVVIGQDDGVADNSLVGGQSALVGSYGWDGSYVAGTSSKAGSAGAGSSFTGGTGDDAKISYYTPSFGGFGAGISFTPDQNHSDSSDTSKTTETGDLYSNHIELMAKYSGEVSGASFTVVGGYKTADAEDADSGTTKREDLSAFELGATVSFGDFTVGANMWDNGDSGENKDSTTDAGNGYSLGLGYSMGDTAVSVGYLTTEKDTGSEEDTYENISLDVEYTVAEGLVAYAGVQFAESDDASDTSSATGESDSTAIVVGTRLTF